MSEFWDQPPTRRPQFIDENGKAVNADFWFGHGGWCTWIVGDRAVSIWVSAKPFPEVDYNVMAVLWVPSLWTKEKKPTRVGEHKFETDLDREIVLRWLLNEENLDAYWEGF